MPPPILYKYCPPERIDILETLQVKFSAPSSFNDTFDSHYLLPRSASKDVKVARIRLRTRLGIFCLSEKPDHQLMWVNYARKHTGFVLGFNGQSPFFEEEGRRLRKVEYRQHPMVLSDADINACFYKSPVWDYEPEWRCVKEFNAAESRLMGFDPGIIREVVFGHDMGTSNIAKIMKFVAGYGMDVQFFESSPDHSSWEMRNQPKTVTLCEHCNGDGYHMEDTI